MATPAYATSGCSVRYHGPISSRVVAVFAAVFFSLQSVAGFFVPGMTVQRQTFSSAQCFEPMTVFQRRRYARTVRGGLGRRSIWDTAMARNQILSSHKTRKEVALDASPSAWVSDSSSDEGQRRSHPMLPTPNWNVCSTNETCDAKQATSRSTLSYWSPTAYQSALNLYSALNSCTDERLSSLIDHSLSVLYQGFRLYGPQSIIGSYNGGKDAVVILHLMRAAYAKYIEDVTIAKDEDDSEVSAPKGETSHAIPSMPKPRVTYFESEHEFPAILALLHESVREFDLDMLAFERGTKFADGLRLIVENNIFGDSIEKKEPSPMGFVLGTRKSDPNAGNQGDYAPSSSYMPPFMRINPILAWTYGDVWKFLRLFDLPYCSLYDEGYTSLGTVLDTLPCPALARDDGSFHPAYTLEDWDQERAGRTRKGK